MDWIEFFKWPEHSGEFQSIPKRAFLLRDRITSSEKKLLQGPEIQSIRLLHSVKQSNSNIPEFVSDEESYLEILFIELTIADIHYEKYYKPAARLIHKLLPHHCLVISGTEEETSLHISLYTKSIHPGNPELRVLKEETFSDPIRDHDSVLPDALAFSNTDKLDLKYFYGYYRRVIQNYNLIPLTDSFRIRDRDQTQKLLSLQSNINQAESNVRSLVSQLKKETQMRERVRVNTEIHQWRTRITDWQHRVEEFLSKEL